MPGTVARRDADTMVDDWHRRLADVVLSRNPGEIDAAVRTAISALGERRVRGAGEDGGQGCGRAGPRGSRADRVPNGRAGGQVARSPSGATTLPGRRRPRAVTTGPPCSPRVCSSRPWGGAGRPPR